MGETELATAMWQKTNDKLGLKPVDPIYCPVCANRKPPVESKLVMRRSRIHNVADVRIAHRDDHEVKRPYAIDIAFKCPQCNSYCVFGVPVDMEYAQKIIQLRGGTVDFVLPEDIWSEDEEIKKRLRELGYW